MADEQKVYFDRSENEKLQEGYFTFIFQPLKEDGETYGISLTGYEVTDMVRARKKSRWHEKQLNLALDGGKIGYWEIDLSTRELDLVSRRWKQHVGRPKQERWTLEDFYRCIHLEDRQRVKKELERSMKNASPYEVDFRVCWPDGSTHWIRTRGQTMQEEDEEQPHCLVGVTEEVTEFKTAEVKLREAVQLRDNFLSIAAHELQTPVTSLKMRGDLFERQVREKGSGFEIQQVCAINKHIDQLSRLTARLLDTSRMNVEDLTLEREAICLDELIEETVDVLRQVTDHTIVLDGEPVRKVYADKFRIGQVLTNLLENAVKYSPEGDRVIVQYRQEPETVLVSVADYGVGISEGDKQRVFERFFKGGEESKATYPGFGMGLYISEQIIRRHNGGIWVEDHPGGGSVFFFSLPVAGEDHPP